MLTVGEILQKERLRKNISLSDVEKKIRVRSTFLAAIEKNDWRQFSSKVYISGIIRNYATFLGLDSAKAIAFFRRDYERREDEAQFKRKLGSGQFLSQRRKSTVIGLTIVSILFFLYFGYQVFRFVMPPSVSILEPSESQFKRVDKVTIVGVTEREAEVMILGNRVYQDDRGMFQYDLPLKAGNNLLKIKVTGANGKSTVVERAFFLAP